MRTKNVVAVLLGVFLLPVAAARAEGPQPGQPGYVDPNQQQYQQQPMGDPNAQQQQAPVEEQTSNEQAQQGRGIEYGGYLYVPIFATKPFGDGATVSPGIGLMGRVGWEFGSGFTAELILGGQWNQVSVDVLGFTGTGSLTNLFGGAGLRFSFLNASALVPFVGAGIQLNFWGTSSDSSSTTNDSIALGINGLVGLAYELSADLAIEAGVRVDWTTAGTVDAPLPGDSTTLFDGGQVYVSPVIGATLYY